VDLRRHRQGAGFQGRQGDCGKEGQGGLIASPCTKVCVMDAAGRYCLGCWRTLAEIGTWSAMTDAEQRAVVSQLDARRRASLQDEMQSSDSPPRMSE
jgi:predicted Fe-S protein YdhL (DUF1289 family)